VRGYEGTGVAAEIAPALHLRDAGAALDWWYLPTYPGTYIPTYLLGGYLGEGSRAAWQAWLQLPLALTPAHLAD
jgi:hypothetical protein